MLEKSEQIIFLFSKETSLLPNTSVNNIENCWIFLLYLKIMIHACLMSPECLNPIIDCCFPWNKITVQRFSLPPDVIDYILNNPNLLPQTCFKLYSSCRYFFPKLKVVPVWCLEVEEKGITACDSERNITCSKKSLMSSDLEFLVVGELRLIYRSSFDFFTSSNISTNLYSIFLRDMTLTLTELLLVAPNAKCVELLFVVVEDSNGSEIPIEVILKHLPGIEEFIS